MVDQEILIPCSSCGKPHPRGEMFGVEPDLLCQPCRDGVSKRLHVRFRPRQREYRPIVTLVCLGLCAVLFLATDVFLPRGPNAQFPAWLAALYQGEPIWAGQVYRHLTCIFLHGGFLHIFMNGLGLWYIGRNVEMGWGHLATAGLVVATGMGAAAVSWTMTTPGSVGISGALLGLIGFLWAQRRVHPIAAAVMNERMVRWIIMMLIIGVVLTQTGRYGVDNWAHGVGLGLGLLFGHAVRHRARVLAILACSLLCVALVVTSVFVAFGTDVPMQHASQYGEVVKTFKMPRQEYRTWWLQQPR